MRGFFKKKPEVEVSKEVKEKIKNLKRRISEAEEKGELRECDRLMQRIVEEDIKAGIL